VYALIREHIPFIESDTTMYGHIESMRVLVENGEVVERAV
jgi:hypothetical protein